jgi:hypothetical protein
MPDRATPPIMEAHRAHYSKFRQPPTRHPELDKQLLQIAQQYETLATTTNPQIRRKKPACICHRKKPRRSGAERASAAPVMVWRGMLRRMKARRRRNSERSASSRDIWIGSHRINVRRSKAGYTSLSRQKTANRDSATGRFNRSLT